MWGKRKDRARKRDIGAFLGDGSEIEGKYTCTGTVVLEATLRGEVRAMDTLIIAENGVVEASVHGVNLVVRGRVVGNITASERVELKSSARVTGDIEAPVIVMDAGAMLDGRCKMTKERAADAPLALVVPIKG